MTNYNERLDEVFKTLNNKAREERASCTERNNWEGYTFAYERLENEAKAAIISRTKELVAEAKPNAFKFDDGQNDATHFYNKAVSEYQQNLLKVLEEV